MPGWGSLFFFIVAYILAHCNGFDDLDGYPWSYECVLETVDGPACQRKEVPVDSSNKIPFRICILTCGNYGGLWPYPAIKTTLGTSLSDFTRGHIQFDPPTYPQDPAPEDLRTMVSASEQIFRGYIEKLVPEDAVESSQPRTNLSIQLSIQQFVTAKFSIDLDESYNLTISKQSEVVTARIVGNSFFGIRHGLETLAQLLDFDTENGYLKIVDQVEIEDKPKFVYRGLMMDTSRNFIPLSDLERLIDGLSYNKMNIFHWHMTDSNSFPFNSSRVPQMIQYGSYGKKKVYNPDDIRRLIAYANQRGVKIVPEFDMPSHAGNGWQWGKEEHGEMSLCVNAEPYREFCIQPPCGQLNPLNDHMYNVLGELFKDFLEVFDNDIFHMGGDEISYRCWESYKNITDWVEENNSDLMGLWGMFQGRAHQKLMEATSNASMKAIVWTSEMTGHARQFIEPKDYIIQIWSEENDTISKGIYEEGYHVIFSNNDTVYLDHGYGPWRGNFYNPSVLWKKWQVIYQNDLLGQVERQVGKEKMEELYQQGKLMGGVAALWAEKADPINMDMKLWPRGAAFAERLWSYPPVLLTQTQLAYPRLIHHRERLVKRGLKADTLVPESCYHIGGFCDIPYIYDAVPQPPNDDDSGAATFAISVVIMTLSFATVIYTLFL